MTSIHHPQNYWKQNYCFHALCGHGSLHSICRQNQGGKSRISPFRVIYPALDVDAERELDDSLDPFGKGSRGSLVISVASSSLPLCCVKAIRSSSIP